MLWLNFLHFYQPANLESYDIKKALDKSYWRLIRLLEENPKLKFTLNISGCLLERLEIEKETNFHLRVKELIRKGKIELTGSAAYHGFLPLLPESEVIKQIKTNEKFLRKYFGSKFKPSGFFLPEMAYSESVAKIIKKLGYSWIILDEIAYSGGGKKRPDFNKIYLDGASGLKVIFRNRELSGAYPPDQLLPMFVKLTKVKDTKKLPADICITATDAELYGLRHEDPTAELEKIAKLPELKTQTISSFIEKIGKNKVEKIKIFASSWESSAQEIKNNEPYKLWYNPKNKIQVCLWKLANLALVLDTKYKKDKNYYWYRWHLVRGIASCSFWWASAHDFSKIFGPYAWSPDGIERGLEDLIRAVRSLFDRKTKKDKLQAEKYYLKIKKLIWEEHWKKHWKQ